MRTYYDNTMMKDYRECPRKFFLRHRKGWRKEGLALPLVFGLSWHSAMDVVWAHYNRVGNEKELINLAMVAFEDTWQKEGLSIDLSLDDVASMSPRIPAVAREMLYQYINHRRNILANCTLLASEQPFAVPMPLDDSGESVWYAGRLDKVIEYSGQRLVIEHKTTTEYKKDGGFKTQYVEGWYLDSQCMGYLFGGSLYFDGLEQVWVDASLVHKQVHDAFRFIPIGHQFGMLAEWVEDTKEWIRRIKADDAKFQARGGLYGGVFPKQQESCVGKFGPCPYADICRTQVDPSRLTEVPVGYVHEPWSPFDVLKLNKLEQGITNEQESKNSSNLSREN